MEFDVVVIGGGAAGLMCAIEAGKRGRRVAVLEHTEQIGKKILISGGGRCNFTNIHCRPENFISSNPHFCKSALARFTPADFLALVEKHHIAWHEKTLGQLFCDGSAREIISMLQEECDAAGVGVFVNCAVTDIRRTTRFEVDSSLGRFQSPVLVIATGGLSIPKMGATPFGYRIAQQFGVAARECWPALVPLTFAEPDRRNFCSLAGVSAEITAATAEQQFREKMLITHRGLSGPAILQISSYWRPGETIAIDLLPGIDIQAELENRKGRGDKAAAKTAVAAFLPKRLADRWFELQDGAVAIAAMSAAAIGDTAARLHNWVVLPNGTEGYGKAEVTGGGVHPDELSSKTMEARRVRGLFFVGEVVDVTGHLGGFNFQWAWASGAAAARSL